MNPVREDWDALCDRCQTVRLPQPRILPGKLGDTYEVSIPQHHRAICKTLHEAVRKVRTWVDGYQSGLEVREEHSVGRLDCPIAEAASLAKRVLDISGEGGPEDHELLAKAVLCLTVHILEN